MFPITNDFKQGDALSPLLFIFVLDYTIRRVQVKYDGLQLIGTCQLLVYADYVSILGGSVLTIKENTEGSLVASNKSITEVNADKNRYLVTPRHQNAGRNQRRLCQVKLV